MDIRTKRTGCIWFSVVGFFFFFFLFSCNELAAKGNIVWNIPWVLKLLSLSILCGVLCGSLLFLALAALSKKVVVRNKECSAPKTFFCSLIIIILCWFPTWLAYYPGICSYDTPIQMEQILSGEYNTHHPLAHTLLMEAFYRLGVQLGNANFGIGAYTFIQMVVLGAAMAGGIALLAKWKTSRPVLVLLTVYSALFPINWYMSITTTKDVYFSVFVFLYFVLFYAILKHSEGVAKRWHIGYIAVTIGMVFFRNNGKYALAVVWFFLALVFLYNVRKKVKNNQWKWLLADTTIGLLAGCILLSGLATALKATEGDKREMLSMPIQQLSRAMVYHGGVGVLEADDNTMGQQDKALLQELFLYESYKAYRPEISDPVKRYTNTYVVRYRAGEFIKTYVNLLFSYPSEFINAGIEVNAGWFSPVDISHATINQNVVKEGYGYVQTVWSKEMEGTGLYRDSKWNGLLDKLDYSATENLYLKIPILRYLVAPGIYLWCYLLLAAWLLTHKRYRELLPLAFVLGYYLTLFLGPTVQLRYLYPLMIVLPYLMVYINACGKKEKA